MSKERKIEVYIILQSLIIRIEIVRSGSRSNEENLFYKFLFHFLFGSTFYL